MTDSCDDPKYDQHVSYDKKTDTYEIWDDEGGCCINLREAKKLVKIFRDTHPELLEEEKKVEK
jgi:hypothetical protein